MLYTVFARRIGTLSIDAEGDDDDEQYRVKTGTERSVYGMIKNKIILFNNKEILIDGKQLFWSDWFKKGIISIILVDETGNLLTFQAF